MAKDPKTEEQKAAQTKPKTRTPYRGSDRYYEDVLEKQKKTRPGYPDFQRYQEILNKRPKAGPAKTASGFGAAFRKARNDYLNDRSKAKTFEWKGNEYHVRIKDETPTMLETQRKKTLSGAFSKTGVKKPVRKRRVARLKKRQAKATTKGKTQRAAKLKKRISRLEKKAGGGLATNDLGLRNRPEKKAVRAMKKGAGKKVAAKVKRTSVPKNKKNMDLAPKRRKGASIKGYQGGGFTDNVDWPGKKKMELTSALHAMGDVWRAGKSPPLHDERGVPMPDSAYLKKPGGMKTGGMAKKQGYSAKLDESLGVRHPGKKTQSLKSRRAESKGAEKAAGKRAYAAVKTMDKGTRKAKPRGVGVAKRGYGKALS